MFKFLNFSFVHYSVVCRMKRGRGREKTENENRWVFLLHYLPENLWTHSLFAQNICFQRFLKFCIFSIYVAYGNTFEHTLTHCLTQQTYTYLAEPSFGAINQMVWWSTCMGSPRQYHKQQIYEIFSLIVTVFWFCSKKKKISSARRMLSCGRVRCTKF